MLVRLAPLPPTLYTILCNRLVRNLCVLRFGPNTSIILIPSYLWSSLARVTTSTDIMHYNIKCNFKLLSLRRSNMRTKITWFMENSMKNCSKWCGLNEWTHCCRSQYVIEYCHSVYHSNAIAIKSAHIVVLYLVYLLESHASYSILVECSCIFGLEIFSFEYFLKQKQTRNLEQLPF